MLNRLLGQNLIHPLPTLSRKTSLQRRANDIVKQERAVDEEGKTEHLEPFERLPVQSQ